MKVDFVLPQSCWVDPGNRDHVIQVASRIAAIRHGDYPCKLQVEVREDGAAYCPLSNSFLLFPPGIDAGQPQDHWRLTSENDSEHNLGVIVLALCIYL